MVGGGSCVPGGILASEDSASIGESCSSEDDEEKEGARAGADLRRGVAVFAILDAGRGGLKAVGLRLGAAFEGPDGMASGRSCSLGIVVL